MANYQIFFGTYSKGEGNGLFRGSFDDNTGSIYLTDSIDIENPSYMQLNGDILYGVSETGSFQGKNGGSLFAVALGEKMTLISNNATNGKSPCHLCIQDNFIFVSNYTEGTLSVFELNKDGSVAESYLSLTHYGKSVNERRQEKSHIHFAAVTPDKAYIAVCDLGLDKVFLYPYSAEHGLSTNAKKIDCPAGSGPRHLTFSADGKYMYILTELSNTVLAYEYNGGNVSFLQEISALPADFAGRSSAAAIHVSPDGKYIASSNRGHESIAVFAIQPDGTLKTVSHIMTGKEPRDFRFSPDGKWILSANQNSGTVTSYKIDTDNQTYTETGSVQLPSPVCILFGLSEK